MKTKRIYIVVFVLVLISVISFFVFNRIQADVNKPTKKQAKVEYPDFAEGEFIVKFKKNTNERQAPAKLKGLSNFKNIKKISDSGVFDKTLKISIDLNKVSKDKADSSKSLELLSEEEKRIVKERSHMAILESLRDNPEVESAELNYKRKASWDPDDPFYHGGYNYSSTGYDLMWGLKNINMSEAWDISKGKDVKVAVIDTGVDYNHEDLSANILKDETGKVIGKNFTDSTYNYQPDDFMDRAGHGTHVAGTIAAVGDNGIGVVGVAPEAKIIPVKGLGDDGSGYDDELAQAIIYAADIGAQVINMSWGGAGNSSVIETALEYASNKGVILIAAAGNDSADAIGFSPANSKFVLSVGAFDPWSSAASFSNYGPKVEIMAPGVDIISTISNTHDSRFTVFMDKYARLSGTSMAAPHIAGEAALMRAAYPSWDSSDIRNALVQSGSDICTEGIDEVCGFGKANPVVALRKQTPYKLALANLNLKDDIYRSDFSIEGSVAGEYLSSYKISSRPIAEPTYYANVPSESIISEGTRPLMGKLLDTSAKNFPAGPNYIKLTAKSQDGSTSIAYDYFFNSKNEIEGYPFKIDNLQVDYPPAKTKLNSTQGNVIIASTYNKIQVYGLDLKLKWEKSVGIWDDVIHKPLIADIDGDANQEIIVLASKSEYESGEDDYNFSYQKVLVYDYLGNLKWTYNLQYMADSMYFPAVFMAEDVNNDKKMEVLVGEQKRNIWTTPYFRLVTLNDRGQVLSKSTVIENGIGEFTMATIGSSDIDSDGKYEVIISHSLVDWSTRTTKMHLSAYKYQRGTDLKKVWSREYPSDSLGRLNFSLCPLSNMKRGGLILATNNYGSLFSSTSIENDNYLYILDRSNGKSLVEKNLGKTVSIGLPMPITQANGTNFILSIKKKGQYSDYSLVNTYNNRLQATKFFDGSEYSGQEAMYPTIVSDLDLDKKLEAIYQDEFRHTNLFDNSKVANLSTGRSNSYPVATYINSNKKVDFMYVTQDNAFPAFSAIHAYELKTTKMPLWPMTGHDNRNTNSCTTKL